MSLINNQDPLYNNMNLNDYLKGNSNVIVDVVEKKYVLASNEIVGLVDKKYVLADMKKEPIIIPAEMTGEPTFKELTGLLQGLFIHQHGNKVGEKDKAHDVLALAIICSLWCGWLSQSKANSDVYPQRYPQEWVERFKKLIVDAFEIGQRYSNDKP